MKRQSRTRCRKSSQRSKEWLAMRVNLSYAPQRLNPSRRFPIFQSRRFDRPSGNLYRIKTARAIVSGGRPEQLKRRLTEYGFGEMKMLAYTAVAQVNNNLTFRQSEVAGIGLFEYFGPLAPNSRPFCRAHVGCIFSLDQILQMDNGRGISAKKVRAGIIVVTNGSLLLTASTAKSGLLTKPCRRGSASRSF